MGIVAIKLPSCRGWSDLQECVHHLYISALLPDVALKSHTAACWQAWHAQSSVKAIDSGAACRRKRMCCSIEGVFADFLSEEGAGRAPCCMQTSSTRTDCCCCIFMNDCSKIQYFKGSSILHCDHEDLQKSAGDGRVWGSRAGNLYLSRYGIINIIRMSLGFSQCCFIWDCNQGAAQHT